MTSFDKMLEKYGLSKDLFGIFSAAMPAAQDASRTQVVQDAPGMPVAQDATVTPDDDTEDTAIPAVELRPDPSQPPWGPEEDFDLLAGVPDLNDDAAEYPF